ncbi:hypothetical protein [Xylophilus sp. GOD-11R]|uniref:hypothetical protein n=1 Tax=Xylophilus sp. GOD-11R TaxID=3089814 RepID=UPI00298C9DC1|nr:hypothetical protein [Xylophilus sp. GOD-11R]WPB55316.1 hypothetical protein R9X41_14300 [Xylophilus sp. GOD-11R]
MNAPPPVPSAGKKRWIPSPVAITGVVLVALVVAGLVNREGPTNEQQQTERDAVSNCWNDARRSNGSAMEQRNKIAECEQMETAFRKKGTAGNP